MAISTPYQIMMILSAESDAEQQAEMVSRVRSLVEDAGGTVDDVAEWGRRKIAYPVRKQADGIYFVVTCQTSAAVIEEISHVMAISKDVVLRAMPFRLSTAELVAVQTNGVPMPADERPEREDRPRGGRRGGGAGGGSRGGGGRSRDRDR
ncbi:MAG: 30S ribosomal protein S6 [Thermoleophilia bacterium]|nr:30S ribosomal protein S6 [Thermoleophilia bacterium]